jgi:hypothetical protein
MLPFLLAAGFFSFGSFLGSLFLTSFFLGFKLCLTLSFFSGKFFFALGFGF